MKLSSSRRLAIAAVAGSVILTGFMTSLPAVAAAPAVVPAGDSFSAVAPTRIMDTRTGLGVPGGLPAPVVAGGTVLLHVAGVAGVPDPVDAVVLNVTAVAPTKNTFVSVYAGDLATPPAVSNINVAAGQVVPNLVTVKVDGAGDVKLFNSAGSVNLLADVTGYYDSTATDTFTPMDPTRILDTRTGNLGGPFPVGPGQTIDLQVGGSLTIPTNADAVVLNVTAVDATTNTFIRVYPTPAVAGPPPTVSNLNVGPGQAVANLVTVALSSNVATLGQVRFGNANGSVDIIADVAGYFSTAAGGSLYTPVAPTRLLDSRSPSTPVGPGGVIDLQVAGQAGVPSTAIAALFNYTAVAPNTATFLEAYQAPVSGHVFPVVSNLNVRAGETRANLASVLIGAGGDVRLRNQAGITNMLVDISGYYTTTLGVDHGSGPTGAPGSAGVAIAASLNSVHPGQFGKVIVTYTTNVDTNPFTLAAGFRAGVSKITVTTTAGVPGVTSFGVNAAPVGVAVPILLSATSADLGATAQSLLVFVPVTLSCHAAPSPPNPAQHANVDIVVSTAPGANVSVVFHGRTTTVTQNSKANVVGRADVIRNIGGSKVGFRVPVTVTVALGTNRATCSTAYTPIA